MDSLAIISLVFSLETLQVIVSIGHILHMLLLWIFLALNSRFVYNIPFRRTSYIFALPRVKESMLSKHKIEHLFVKSVFNEQFDDYNKIDYSRGINSILIPLFFTVTTQPPFGVFLILLVSYASHL